MAVKSLVIEVNASSAQEAQSTVNSVLTTTPISATSFLESIVISFQETNQTAMIVIWYDDGS